MSHVCLETTIANLKLKNPVMPASGTFGWVREFSQFYDVALLGAIIPKTVTLEPRKGNSPQRIVETASGMLNSIGLQNPGFEYFSSEYWPFVRQLDTVHIVNIAARSVEEFVECALRVAELPEIHAIELNASCPNVSHDGRAFGSNATQISELVRNVVTAVDIPIITKLTPNVTDIVELASAAEEAGSAALTVANTFLGMAIDINSAQPVLDNIRGGLSGPAIKPLSLRAVYDVCGAVSIPVIGVGGISSGRDVLEYIMAGACAVQIGTMNFVQQNSALRIISELDVLMEQLGYDTITECIGICKK